MPAQSPSINFTLANIIIMHQKVIQVLLILQLVVEFKMPTRHFPQAC